MKKTLSIASLLAMILSVAILQVVQNQNLTLVNFTTQNM